MTIKWGDPIECNGVRPDWLRDGERLQWVHSLNASTLWTETLPDELNFATGKPHQISHIRVRADHPAYVALARGFHPWSGGESAPDDWDGETVLLRGGVGECPGPLVTNWSGDLGISTIIGYRKRNTRFDEPHLARIEVEGSAPVDGVFIKRMTNDEATEFANKAAFDGLGHAAPCYAASGAHACLKALGLIRPETTAERFTRETGHEVTEAVEAALNWKDTHA